MLVSGRVPLDSHELRFQHFQHLQKMSAFENFGGSTATTKWFRREGWRRQVSVTFCWYRGEEPFEGPNSLDF